MNKIVELIKRNEVLDAIRLAGDRKLSIKEYLGVVGDYNNAIGQILFGKYRLIIVWGGDTPIGLSKSNEYIYVLNIISEECYSNFNWKGEWAKTLLNNQLSQYMPIIQKFMVDALTDSLNIQ